MSFVLSRTTARIVVEGLFAATFRFERAGVDSNVPITVSVDAFPITGAAKATKRANRGKFEIFEAR
jgi:hypothetical protein